MWFFPSNKPLVPSGDDVYTPNHLFPPDSGKSLGMVHLERGCLRRVRHPDWRRPTQGGDQLNILQLGLDVIGQLFLSMSLSTCFLKHHCDIADATAFLLLHLGETCKHQHFSVFFFYKLLAAPHAQFKEPPFSLPESGHGLVQSLCMA